MKIVRRAFVATLGISILAAGCSSTIQDGVLADGEYNTESIEILPTSFGKLVKIDGSSTVFPISYEATRRYQRETSEAPAFAASFSGTGGGFERFCVGETDINGASRPIRVDEMDTCRENGIEYVELPIALDAITIVVNAENTWATDITVQELQEIWQPDA
ncbi:MAG: substrate-binding domain-containing protein, partial [Cyanobacteria bacterium J06633_2]